MPGTPPTPAAPHVVAGVDGSPSSYDALEVAADEARMRRCGLTVVHAYTTPAVPPVTAVPTLPGWAGEQSLGPVQERIRQIAEHQTAEAVARARRLLPDQAVTGSAEEGNALDVLVNHSRGAALLVVGSRGLGGFQRALLGSVSTRLAGHSACPVMIVRGGPGRAGPVVLGADGSAAGEAAVDFAFAEAARREVPLTAIHCWRPADTRVPQRDALKPYPNNPEVLAENEERLLAEVLAGRVERHPSVRVERRVVHGRARPTLIEASRDAGLLVLGARGHGGFAGLRLGSVSHAVQAHAHCPVAVVRGTRASANGE